MANGSFSKYVNSTLGLYCEYTYSQSVLGNYTDITVDVWVKYYNLEVYPRTGTITINGTSTSFTSSTIYDYSGSSSTKIGQATTRVQHDSDGSKTNVDISVKWNAQITYAGVWYSSLSASTTISALPDIPKASTLDSLSCSTSYFNGTLTYKYTPQSASYYNKCNISLNLDGTYVSIKSISIGKKTASQQTATVTLSSSELTTIYSKLPKTTKGVLRFTLRTYSDSGYSTQVGSASYKEVTLTIPTSIIPSIDALTLDPVNIITNDGTSRNLLVQEKNKLKISVSGCTAGSGSTIKSYTFSGPSISSTVTSSSASASVTSSSTMSSTGTLKYTVKITDTRGRTASKSATITCYAYSDPSFSSFSAYRCDSSGNADDNGTYIKYSFGVKYASVNSTNKSTVKIYYKKNTSSSWSSVSVLTNSTTTSATSIIKNSSGTSITFDASSTYLVYAVVTDNYNQNASSSTITIFGASRILNIRKNGTGIAFGKMAESDNLFECKWPVTLYDDVTVPDNGGPVLNGYSVGTLGVGTNIPSGSSLDDYITPGVYRSTGADISETLTNTPHTTSGFKLVVEYLGNSGYLRQVVIPRTSSCKYYIRYRASSSWYAWKTFESTESIASSLDFESLVKSVDNLTVAANQYHTGGNYGINMNNSDIIEVNGIYFNDPTDSAGEGINFINSDGSTCDTLYTKNGMLKFHSGRSKSTALSGKTIYTSANFRRGTCTLSSSSATTVTFSSALGGTPTVLLTPLTTTTGYIPGKVHSADANGFTAIIGGSAVSSAKFAYLAIYY